ncbi:MAG: hypothetical protein A3G93_05335 [Nitrospinae bacterium RIFCSPLOWO2_12_FULL_45_22]|nr:MAG: hypothetical protein A3G93_05335 [Nitrospinae bacterium RIFCSPLOWO2_12_FULL_45_22]
MVEEGVVLSADIFNLNELIQPLIEQREPGLINSHITSLLDLLTPLIRGGQGELISFSGWGFLALFNLAPDLRQDINNAIKTALEIMVALERLNFPLKLSAGIDWGDLFGARNGIDNNLLIGEPVITAQLLQALARDNEIVITNLVEPEDREFIKELITAFGFKMLTQRVSLRDKKGKIIRIMEGGKEEPREFTDFFKNFLK